MRIVSRAVGAAITSPLGIGAPVQCVGPVSARGAVDSERSGAMPQHRRHDKISTEHELVVDVRGALITGGLEEKPAPGRAFASTSLGRPRARRIQQRQGSSLVLGPAASPSVQRREWPGTTPSCIERPLVLTRPTESSGLPHCEGRQGCAPRAPMPSSNPSPRLAVRSTGPARRHRAAGKPPVLSRHK